MRALIGRTVLQTLTFMLFTACLSVTAYATSFAGTITETITTSTSPHPNLQVGQIAVGMYAYDSPTVDGDFANVFHGQFFPSALPTLSGFVDTFFPGDPRFLQAGGIGVAYPFTHLTVTNGSVTAFHIDGEAGPCDYGFTNFQFSIFCIDLPPFGGVARGTLVFSDPVQAPELPTSMLSIVGIAIGGYLARRLSTS